MQGRSNADADNLTVAEAESQQTQNFLVENMTCATCPITVRKAMEQVTGVSKVVVDFEKKSALVLDKRTLTLLATLELQGSAGDPILPPRDSWSIFYLEQPNANQHTTLTEVRYNTMHT